MGTSWRSPQNAVPSSCSSGTEMLHMIGRDIIMPTHDLRFTAVAEKHNWRLEPVILGAANAGYNSIRSKLEARSVPSQLMIRLPTAYRCFSTCSGRVVTEHIRNETAQPGCEERSGRKKTQNRSFHSEHCSTLANTDPRSKHNDVVGSSQETKWVDQRKISDSRFVVVDYAKQRTPKPSRAISVLDAKRTVLSKSSIANEAKPR